MILEEVDCTLEEAAALKLVCKEWRDAIQDELSVSATLQIGKAISFSGWVIRTEQRRFVNILDNYFVGLKVYQIWNFGTLQKLACLRDNEKRDDLFLEICDLVPWSEVLELKLSFCSPWKESSNSYECTKKLVSCLGLCHSLEVLALKDVPVSIFGDEVKDLLQRSPIRTLSCSVDEYESDENMLAALQDHKTLSRIEHLSLKVHDSAFLRTTRRIVRILDASKKSLRSIHLRLFVPHEGTTVPARMEEISLERLERMHLDFHRVGDCEATYGLLPIKIQAPLRSLKLEDDCDRPLVHSLPYLLTEHLEQLELSVGYESEIESHFIPILHKCVSLRKLVLHSSETFHDSEFYKFEADSVGFKAAFYASFKALFRRLEHLTSIPLEELYILNARKMDPRALVSLVSSRNDPTKSRGNGSLPIKKLVVRKCYFDCFESEIRQTLRQMVPDTKIREMIITEEMSAQAREYGYTFHSGSLPFFTLPIGY